MSTTVNRQPANVPLVDPQTGLITREWFRFFTDTFTRMGGQKALTNTDLATLSDGKYLGVFSSKPSQQLVVKQGDGVTVTQDITGYTVTINMDQIIGAARAFFPRQDTTKQAASNDASSVIANRVFRA